MTARSASVFYQAGKLAKCLIKGAAVASAVALASAAPAFAIWQECGEGKDSSWPYGPPFKPEKVYRDVNGVDLGLGNFSPTMGASMSIGDPETGGLIYVINAGAGGRDWHASLGNFNASVSKKRSEGDGGGYFQVNGLLTSDTFYRETDTSPFTSVEGSGARLQQNGTYSFKYTAADGTVTDFGNAYNSNPETFNVYEGRVGHITKQTKPNGEVLTFAYDIEIAGQPKPLVGNCADKFVRLSTVRSNFGYSLKNTYASNSLPTTFATYNNWVTPVSTTLYNNTVDSTSYTGEWPTFAYSGAGHLNLDSVTDSEGGVTSYTYTGSSNQYVASIRFPGSTVDDITVTYEADALLNVPGDDKQRVKTVTHHGQTWTYSYSDSGDITSGTGATRTTTVTAPDNSTTVAVTKLWMTDVWYNQGILISFGRIKANLESVTDPLGRITTYQYDSYGRKTRETFDEGNYIQYTYDARGNITETRKAAKPGSGLADIVTSAVFLPSSSSNSQICNYFTYSTYECNKPTSITDANGNTTNYTYDANHGGVLTETLPDPDGAGPLARPQIRYTYEQKQAKHYYSYGSATVVTGDPVYMLTETSSCSTGSSCDNAATETVMTYVYPSSANANNLELLSATASAGDSSITSTTTFSYCPAPL